MKVNFRPMTAIEAWQYILNMHGQYHKNLKWFGYLYDIFIPRWPFLDEMFKMPQLSPQQIEFYRDKFLSRYNATQLHNQDKVLESEAQPALECVADTLAPFVKKWGMKIPDDITIKVTYGYGASYKSNENTMVLRGTRMPSERVAKTLQHELVHMIIQKEIIEKYRVPQDLKERIVDIICSEYFGREPQRKFINSFANKYITRAVIENDLPGVVQKMMADFAIMNQKLANTKSNG